MASDVVTLIDFGMVFSWLRGHVAPLLGVPAGLALERGAAEAEAARRDAEQAAARLPEPEPEP